MKLSDEELKRIQESHKKKNLGEIIDEEKHKKEDDDKKDEDGDCNFISNITENNQEETKTKKESVFTKLKEDLDSVVEKLNHAIRPVNTELRSLDNEIGGVEENKEKTQEKTNKDVDVWDKRVEEVSAGFEDGNQSDQEDNKAFIHLVKTGLFGGKRRKRKRSMGQIDLGAAAEEGGTKTIGHVGRLAQLRESHNQNKGGGGIQF